MTRKETTAWLSALTEQYLYAHAVVWAKEVVLDPGTPDVRRIDYLSFMPDTVIGGVSGIEKGVFTAYEVKSGKADYLSGYGKNFIAEQNFLVFSMDGYKETLSEDPSDAGTVGLLIACPVNREVMDEFDRPTTPTGEISGWCLQPFGRGMPRIRKKSIAELLYCMMKAGH